MAKEDDGTEGKMTAQMSAPPGFGSHTSFTLKNSESNKESCSSMDYESDFKMEFGCVDGPFGVVDFSKLNKSLRRRPWMLHNEHTDIEESVMDHLENPPLKKSLPKGVIRGCSSCDDCQNITATWRPEESRTPVIEDAPIFNPTEEEFKDTLKYIASIRKHAEEYGICRIVPPPSWKLPCLIKGNNTWETYKFRTRVQRIDELQYWHSKRKLYEINEKIKGKMRRISTTGLESDAADGCTTDYDKAGICTDGFDFEHGPEFTLKTFRNYANDFTFKYFSKKDKVTGSGTRLQEMWNPSENIEGEYWRILENPTEEIEVLSGADVDATAAFGSGFPVRSNSAVKNDHSEYMEVGWNLNNVSQLPGSLLAFETSKASPVSIPRLQIGMCFSSSCWKAEEHHLYSLSYVHLGAPKICYGIPGRYSVKFEALLKKKFPELSQCPELSHKLVTQLSPSILKAEGIPVYRCKHHPRHFVLVLPGAYHSGFDRGFNCSEHVNFAPLDWLPHGQNAIELYTELGRKTILSHDKLLLGAAMQAVRELWEVVVLKRDPVNKFQWTSVCGKDAILTRALKSRVKRERTRREFLCASSQSRKMEKDFDSTIKRECTICFYDLHLSATGCSCSLDKYSCLNHSKQLCSCPWSSRFFLFRYTISELELLIEALEENSNAIHKWASENLGLTTGSHSFKVANKLPPNVSSGNSGEKCVLNSEKETMNAFFRSTEENIVKNHGSSYGKAPSRNLSSGRETGEKPSSACQIDVIILSDEEDD